ncbi:MAG: hypothetical protein HY829_13465 [Actinobacteria bacterium]|nr:hypothetical protein [Actinomycetota bacterium]
MISPEVFDRLVVAASRAPSADNMQAWAFARRGDAVEVHLEPARVLPTDVNQMFAWVGLGAAVENLVVAAGREGLSALVEDDALRTAQGSEVEVASLAATPVTVRLAPGGAGGRLAEWVERRETNRGPYETTPLDGTTIDELTRAIADLEAGLHWAGGAAALEVMASMDARSTYIRLEHRPLHDELFDILRFDRRELEETRFGLDFASLGIPVSLVRVARLLRHARVMKVVSRLGIGRLVARQLAAKLRAAGAVCLVTACGSGAADYVQAGRAMERLWLEATARGLAVQPHGVLPQYLTKLDVEPDGFTAHFAETMARHREPFHAIFPVHPGERPAIVLRIGRPLEHPARRSLRLPIDQLKKMSQVVDNARPA